MKPDYAHVWTDEQIAALERRIYRIYFDAAKELKATIEDYFEKFKARDARQRAKLEAGEITEEEYKLWRAAQIGRGERFEALRDRIAERYTNANETTVAYINDQTPSIYSLNRNFTAYTIEQVHGNVGFNLWDESTVRRLIVEQPNLMPYYPQKLAVKRGIDLDWGKKQITASITSSILQGKNLKRMADDLQARMQTMNRDSAIRTARTAYTTAQNAGRQDAFVAAEKLGIKVRKRWIATKDNRTRHDHGMADGQTVGADEPFIFGGYKMMFPGDGEHGAPGRLIYNCRCTMRTVEKEGIEQEPRKMRVRDPETGESVVIEDMIYSEWAGWKAETGQKQSAYNSAKINRQYKDVAAMNEYDYFSEEQEKNRLKAIQDLASVDKDTAKKYMSALCGTREQYLRVSESGGLYSGDGWFFGADSEIREGITEQAKEKATLIDAYIQRAPKYEGTIYRGLSLDKKDIESFKTGRTFTENGLFSSWTSSNEVAVMFADGRSEELGKSPVIIYSKNPKYGTPAAHLSIFGSDEQEILVSNMKNKSYTIGEILEKDGTTYIELIGE